MTTLKSVRFPRLVMALKKSELLLAASLLAGIASIILGFALLEEPTLIASLLLVATGLTWLFIAVTHLTNSCVLKPVTLILNKKQNAGWQVLITINQTLVVWEKDLKRFLKENGAVIDDPSIRCLAEMEIRLLCRKHRQLVIYYAV